MIKSIGEGSCNILGNQDLALSMLEDGFTNIAVSNVASLGTYGKHSGHVERDFHRWTKHLYGLEIDPYFITVEVQLPKREQSFPMQIPCLLMYELLHSIRHAGPLQSTVSLGTPEDRCKFWQRSMAEGRATARDLTIPRSQWHELVPCFFHMDGAEFYRNSEFLVWSWCAATSEATNILGLQVCVHDVAIIAVPCEVCVLESQ